MNIFHKILQFFDDLAIGKDHSKYSVTPEDEYYKSFRYEEYDEASEARLNIWYRLKRWKRPNFLMIRTEWPNDWIVLIKEENVVGMTYDNRIDWFLMMGDYPDFRVFLEKEPDNPVDPNAIKVMGSATSDQGELITKQLGYLPKETAKRLKKYENIDARPYSVLLPVEDSYYELVITIFVNRRELYHPVGNDKPICPYCSFKLEKMLVRKKACPNCKNPIFVRTRPFDRKKVLVTEEQVKEIQEQYEKSL